MAIQYMTREEYRQKYGVDAPTRDGAATPTTPAAPKPKKDLLGTATDVATTLFPGTKQIGESLVSAGTNVANLATGGVKKFQQGLPENTVDVPKLIGGYGQAAITAGSSGIPIAKPAQLAATSGRGAAVYSATQGAKNIALAKNVGGGAALGYASDVTGSLKDGESAQGVVTPGLGTALGAAGGAVANKFSNSKRVGDIPSEVRTNMKIQGAEKTERKIIELVMEKPNKRTSVSAFELAGKEGGVEAVGKNKQFKVQPTEYDKARVESVRGIVDPKRNPVENNTLINNEIKRTTEEELLPYLQSNPRIFNVATVNNRLRSIEMPDLFKSDDTLSRTYNLVRQRMVGAIQSQPKTMEGLWNARKQFDREVKEQFGDAAFDSEKNTAIKRAIQDMRREVNDYIGEEIGDGQFKQYMGKLSHMYEARDNIAEKAYDLLNSDKYSRIWKRLTPRQRSLALWGTGVLGASAGAKIVFAGE